MATADQIARFILELLDSDGDCAELRRSALADRFGCAPSQINYVIATRFSPEQGYAVESRRGGGGYIRITRVRTTPRLLLMHTVNAVGEELSQGVAEALLVNAVEAGALSPAAARLIAAAMSDQALRPVRTPCRNAARAALFKQLIVSVLSTDYQPGALYNEMR